MIPPVFSGESLTDYVNAWLAASREDQRLKWHQAAIAAKLVRANGQRTDSGRGPTLLQEFCGRVLIGPEYVSRLARTYRAFDRPDDPGIKKLLSEPRLTFKHFLIAATCYSKGPKEALEEALCFGWSANQMQRMVTERRVKFDEGVGNPARDDDDLQHERLPEPTTRVPGTKRLSFVLTKRQCREFVRQIHELRAAMGKTSDVGTLLAVVEQAHSALPAISSRKVA
jgi:hypothetical protein